MVHYSVFRLSAIALVSHIAVAGIVLLAGCGSGSGGDLSEYDRMQLEKTQALEVIRSKGAKMEEKMYPQGKAWSVDLSGQTITDETFDQLMQAGYISELNFSGSTLTDAFAAKLNSEKLRGVLLKLDVSKTEFSDVGLAELKDANLLQELNVTGSKVTQAGIDKFRAERANNPNVMFKQMNIKK